MSNVGMKVDLTHKLEFRLSREPTIHDLYGLLDMARAEGMPGETPVYIRAGQDERDHGYTFYASILRVPASQFPLTGDGDE